MPVSNHISALERKHRDLDEGVRQELSHPSSDDLLVASKKRQKLAIKDEIERLQSA